MASQIRPPPLPFSNGQHMFHIRAAGFPFPQIRRKEENVGEHIALNLWGKDMCVTMLRGGKINPKKGKKGVCLWGVLNGDKFGSRDPFFPRGNHRA